MKNDESAFAVPKAGAVYVEDAMVVDGVSPVQKALSLAGTAAADSSFFILHSSFKRFFILHSSFTDDSSSFILHSSFISKQRREQAMCFRHDDDRRRCIAAYLLLKEALAREYGITENPEFGYHEGGKPFLIGHPDVHFSLSHCRAAVACAVGDEPVGIDIETIRPYKPALARHVLSDTELHEVETSERPDIAFIRLWTMKESYLKMTGEGIRSDLRQVPLSKARFTTHIDVERGCICTVCCRSSA